MNIIFMRHGEAIDNVRKILSDKEIFWSTLTESGKQLAIDTLNDLSLKVDKIYVSPLPRTIETAHYASEKFPNAQVIVDNRIREIYHGKYSGKENNDDLDRVREKQVDGNYFIRFGEYGENKMDLELRLSSFLKDVKENNFENNTIMIVSHGSVTSFMKRILSIKTPHIQTGKIEVFEDVDYTPLMKYAQKLKSIKNATISQRLQVIENLSINGELRKTIIKIIKKEFNNIEFPDEVFNKYIDGLKTNNLIQISNSKFDDDIILICFYYDYENFAKNWMEHYISIGIRNFVMIDNNSTDKSKEIIESFSNKVNIDFWKINESYNCYKMCGWKQKIMEFYGANHKYITVDSDELFAYPNYKKITVGEYLNKQKSKNIKALMVDVYPQGKVLEGKIEDFKYVDKSTYEKSFNKFYGKRFFGGPRERIFGIKPSLQKVPFINYTGREIYINDHFYYPWNINKNSKFKALLLHYKFLPGDKEKIHIFAQDERHWNNSREYKVYDDLLTLNKTLSFYETSESIPLEEIFDYIKFE